MILSLASRTLSKPRLYYVAYRTAARITALLPLIFFLVCSPQATTVSGFLVPSGVRIPNIPTKLSPDNGACECFASVRHGCWVTRSRRYARIASRTVKAGETGGEVEQMAAAAAAAAAAATATAAPTGATTSSASDELNDGAGMPMFVYGTLMNDKVLGALLGRVPKTESACLRGYHRYRIRNYVFPAIRPKEGSAVNGLLMPGLSAREKRIFDLFEDDDYYKVDAEVEPQQGSREKVMATCYVWNASAEDQLYSTWEPSTHFTENGPLPDYTNMERHRSFSSPVFRHLTWCSLA